MKLSELIEKQIEFFQWDDKVFWVDYEYAGEEVYSDMFYYMGTIVDGKMSDISNLLQRGRRRFPNPDIEVSPIALKVEKLNLR